MAKIKQDLREAIIDKYLLQEKLSSIYATVDREAFDDNKIHVSFKIDSTNELQALSKLGVKYIVWDPKDDEEADELPAGEYTLDDWISAIASTDETHGVSNLVNIVTDITELSNESDRGWQSLQGGVREILRDHGTRSSDWVLFNDETKAYLLIDMRLFGGSRNYKFFRFELDNGGWVYDFVSEEAIPQNVRHKLLRKLGLEKKRL